MSGLLLRAIGAFVAFLFVSAPTQASSVRWQLNDVNLVNIDDSRQESTLTGSFDYDVDLNTFSNINISSTFLGVTRFVYNDSNTSAYISTNGGQFVVTFGVSLGPLFRIFSLRIADPLTTRDNLINVCGFNGRVTTGGGLCGSSSTELIDGQPAYSRRVVSGGTLTKKPDRRGGWVR